MAVLKHVDYAPKSDFDKEYAEPPNNVLFSCASVLLLEIG